MYELMSGCLVVSQSAMVLIECCVDWYISNSTNWDKLSLAVKVIFIYAYSFEYMYA